VGLLQVVFDDGVLGDQECRLALLLVLSLQCGAVGYLREAQRLLVARLSESVALARVVRSRDVRLLFWLCLVDGGAAFARSVAEVVAQRADVVGFLCDAVVQFDDVVVEGVASSVARSLVAELEASGLRVDVGVVHACCDRLYGRVLRVSSGVLWASFRDVMAVGGGVVGRVWVRVARELLSRGAVARARAVLGFVDASSLDAVMAREFAAVRVLVGGAGVES
jgi:hypothetical protein